MSPLRMQLEFIIIIAFATLTFYIGILGEWVEIKQVSPNATTIGNNTKTRKVINRKVLLPNTTITTPSSYWVDYQRERLIGNRLNKNAQQLIVSGEENLRNSAKIVVPASVTNDTSNSAVTRNQIVQTKTRVNVIKTDGDVVASSDNESHIKSTAIDTNSNDEEANERVEDVNDHNADNDDDHDDDDAADDDDDDDDDDDTNKIHNNEAALQFPSMQGFMKFLKSMQRTWMKKSGFSIEKKIHSLKKLRDRLMSRIEQQFTQLWEPKQHRRKRGILDESNLNFPPEAALMSINFLTFAVFLIKLVLQVVNIIKSKHYTVAGLGLNTGALGNIK